MGGLGFSFVRRLFAVCGGFLCCECSWMFDFVVLLLVFTVGWGFRVCCVVLRVLCVLVVSVAFALCGFGCFVGLSYLVACGCGLWLG